jgi:hypothetical protein
MGARDLWTGQVGPIGDHLEDPLFRHHEDARLHHGGPRRLPRLFLPDTSISSGQWRIVSGAQTYQRLLKSWKAARPEVAAAEEELSTNPMTTHNPEEQLEALRAFGTGAATICSFYQHQRFSREAFFLFRRGTSMKKQIVGVIRGRLEQLQGLGPVSVAWGSGGQNGSFGRGMMSLVFFPFLSFLFFLFSSSFI